jgi:hypothetical protein
VSGGDRSTWQGFDTHGVDEATTASDTAVGTTDFKGARRCVRSVHGVDVPHILRQVGQGVGNGH